jgi:hypothetical protein
MCYAVCTLLLVCPAALVVPSIRGVRGLVAASAIYNTNPILLLLGTLCRDVMPYCLPIQDAYYNSYMLQILLKITILHVLVYMV